MPYRLHLNESPAAGVQRMAVEQLEKALVQLTEAPDGRDGAVHDARKRFKKVRALLRLVRDEIGEESYQRENESLRDAGRRLAEVRESQVLIETVDGLCSRYSEQLADDAFADIREQLVSHHDAVLASVVDEEQMAAVAEVVREALERVPRWPIESDDFSAFRGGLHRVYKRGFKAKDNAYAQGTTEAFHEWRKRVKYLWYQTRILRPVWPAMMKSLADGLHDLADDLGEEHDLADLRDWLVARSAGDASAGALDDERKVLLALIDRRRSDVRASARPRGERLFAEDADTFLTRMESYWVVLTREEGNGRPESENDER